MKTNPNAPECLNISTSSFICSKSLYRANRFNLLKMPFSNMHNQAFFISKLNAYGFSLNTKIAFNKLFMLSTQLQGRSAVAILRKGTGLDPSTTTRIGEETLSSLKMMLI